MPRPECPSNEDLSNFVRCALEESVSDAVLLHLEDCRDCEETVAALEASQTLATPATKLAVLPFESESECRELVQGLIAGQPIDLPPAGCELGPGTMVRDYRIERLIGTGGMGAVYLAVHQRLQRRVALKILRRQNAHHPEAHTRFNREMRSLGQLDHPQIVRALDAGEDAGIPFLVMDYVEGIDLGVLVSREGPLPIADACAAISQAANGLQYAAEKGFVHRDVKPSNLMLCRCPNNTGMATAIVKVLDLGLARVVAGDDDSQAEKNELTLPDQFIGTLEYMAPEQGGDTHGIDARADIYALGATLYKLLTGETPFAKHCSKPLFQRLAAIATTPIPDVRNLRPDVPAEIAQIVQRMMARDPAARFQSCSDVVRALEPFCAGADLHSWLVPKPERATKPTIAPGLASMRPPSRWRRRLGQLAVAVVALSVLSAIIINTRYGRVVVSGPNGELPSEVSIEVSQNGELISILQKENNWTAYLKKGAPFHLELRGGGDDLTLNDRVLTVSSMGETRLTVEFAPAAVTSDVAPAEPSGSITSATAAPTERVQPTFSSESDAPDSASTAKPFVLTRNGESVREFKTLAGAIAESTAEDIIEIRSSDRIECRITDSIAKPVHVRSAAGFRPHLVFAGGNRTWGAPAIQLDGPVTCEGLDVSGLTLSHTPGLKQPFLFSACRFSNYCPVEANQVQMQNCILVSSEGVRCQGESGNVALENCLLRCWNCTVSFAAGESHLSLKNCTMDLVSYEVHRMVRVSEGGQLTVDAEGNLLRDQTQGYLIDPTQAKHIDWRGKNNCFAGDFYQAFALSDDGQWKPTGAGGIEAWNSLWKQPEIDPLVLPDVSTEMGRIQRLVGPSLLSDLDLQMSSLRLQSGLTTSGPDVSIIGPGQPQLRALAAAGRAVSPDQLRPERREDGAIVLLRDGNEVAGFRTVLEAINAAESGDHVEIRTDGDLGSITWTGRNRELTIRAGLGYSPSFVQLVQLDGGDRLSFEGLQVEANLGAVADLNWHRTASDAALTIGYGTVARVANCTLLGPQSALLGYVERTSNGVGAEIRNSVVPRLLLVSSEGSITRIDNCVLKEAILQSNEPVSEPERVRFDRVAFWNPVQASRGQIYFGTDGIQVESKSSIFVAPEAVLGGDLNQIHWTGTRNLFVYPNAMIYANISTLDDFQGRLGTDVDSHAFPLQFDPHQWRIVPRESPGYNSRTDGKDYGAHIDQLATVLPAL